MGPPTLFEPTARTRIGRTRIAVVGTVGPVPLLSCNRTHEIGLASPHRKSWVPIGQIERKSAGALARDVVTAARHGIRVRHADARSGGGSLHSWAKHPGWGILFGTRVPSAGVQIVHETGGKVPQETEENVPQEIERDAPQETEDGQQVLATDVAVAETTLEQLKGVMFEKTLPSGYGLVFPFEAPKRRGVHMLFVRVPIDIIWTVEERVTAADTLQPWTGYGRERADRIIELPAGTAADVAVGDRVRLQG